MLIIKFIVRSFSIISFSLVGPVPAVTTLVVSEVQCQPGSPEGVGQGTDRIVLEEWTMVMSGRFVEGTVCLGESIRVRVWHP